MTEDQKNTEVFKIMLIECLIVHLSSTTIEVVNFDQFIVFWFCSVQHWRSTTTCAAALGLPYLNLFNWLTSLGNLHRRSRKTGWLVISLAQCLYAPILVINIQLTDIYVCLEMVADKNSPRKWVNGPVCKLNACVIIIQKFIIAFSLCCQIA